MLKKLDIQTLEALSPILDTFKTPLSDYTRTNFAMWYEQYDAHLWSFEGQHYLIHHPFASDQCAILQPFGPHLTPDQWQSHLEKALVQLATLLPGPLTFKRLDEGFCNIIKALKPSARITHASDHDDYIYKTKDLADLSGNLFHKKKNHVNQFNRYYGDLSEVETISTANAMDCLKCSKKWCMDRSCDENPSLCYEFQGIKRILTSWEDYPVEGLLIRYEGEVIAFTFGEALTSDYFVIHIEKADATFKGVYAKINQLMAASLVDRYPYTNREQDLGIEGLRKAKLSYHPDHMIKKYTLQL